MRTDELIIILFLTILAIVAFVTFTSPILMDIYGQTTATQQVAQVKEQVQSTASQVDATTTGLGITGAGLAVAIGKQLWDGRKLKDSDKRTDRDTGVSQLIMYRLIQTMDAMLPEVSKCLDQPFNSDPMQKHITIRMKLAEDANSTAAYLMTALNTVVPSMTPSAAVIVADAGNQKAAAQQASPAPSSVVSQTPPPNTDQPN